MTVLAQREPGSGEIHLAGHCRARNTHTRALFLRINRSPDRNRVAPTVTNVTHGRNAPHNLLRLCRQFYQRIDVAADKPDLNRRFDGRRKLEQRRTGQYIGIILPHITVEALFDGRRGILRRQFDQDIGKIGLGPERRTRQIVAGRRSAHRHRHVPDRRLLAQPGLDTRHITFRITNIVTVGQETVGLEVRFIEVREEVLRESPHHQQRYGEEARHNSDR